MPGHDPPLHLNERSGVPFYRQLVDQLTDQIRAGLLPPGALLPSVRALSGTLQISLITVRRAYEELETAGLLERRQGQGTFVTEQPQPPSPQDRDDARADLRLAVERARHAGLTPNAIRAVVEGALTSPQPEAHSTQGGSDV